MDNPIAQLFRNQVFVATLAAWSLAQVIKVIINMKKEKKFNFRWIFNPGGMPSAHTATVSALSTAVGIIFGLGSSLFAVTLVFSIMIIFDAGGFRRLVGRQATILNKIVDDLYLKKKIEEKRLRELLGHTPVEVFAGGALGIAVAIGVVKMMF